MQCSLAKDGAGKGGPRESVSSSSHRFIVLSFAETGRSNNYSASAPTFGTQTAWRSSHSGAMGRTISELFHDVLLTVSVRKKMLDHFSTFFLHLENEHTTVNLRSKEDMCLQHGTRGLDNDQFWSCSDLSLSDVECKHDTVRKRYISIACALQHARRSLHAATPFFCVALGPHGSRTHRAPTQSQA